MSVSLWTDETTLQFLPESLRGMAGGHRGSNQAASVFPPRHDPVRVWQVAGRQDSCALFFVREGFLSLTSGLSFLFAYDTASCRRH